MLKFSKLYLEYKSYIESKSQYSPKVVKDFTFNSTYFPIIDFQHQNSMNTNDCTVDGIESYDDETFVVTIYAQDDNGISRNIITEELIELTQQFLGRYKNMRRTACRPIPNLETNVLRTMMKYECRYGNIYGNIIRR